MDAKHISIADYQYDLPDERIAKFPVSPRDHSRLLVYDHGRITDDYFYNLADHLPKGELMVFNNTKVIHARLHFRKTTGALIEVFLLEPFEPTDYEQMFLTRNRCTWLCLVGNLKKWKDGVLERELEIGGEKLTVRAERKGMQGTSFEIVFEWDNDRLTFADILDAAGQLPIPPYLNRETQQSDLTTYQTVYSKIKGSVAAPTAGLHFTPEVLASLDARGLDREELTLHVGAGTFKPVKSAEMGGHVMHTEHVSVRRQTLQKLLDHDCRAIAVGTTSVRTLESLYYMGLKVMAQPDLQEEQLHVGQWEPYEASPDPSEGGECLTEFPSAAGSPSGECLMESRGVAGSPPSEGSGEAIRALLAWMDRNNLEVLHASTQIIIAPGYEFHLVNRLVTNFHQPQSTLLLLVSAFTKGRWRDIYSHAIDNDYRFLSYGDSSLLSV